MVSALSSNDKLVCLLELKGVSTSKVILCPCLNDKDSDGSIDQENNT